MLLGGRLLPYLPLRFAEQVTRLAARLRDNLLRLVRSALGDVAPGLAGGVADVRGFISCDVAGRPLRRRTLSVRSSPPTLDVRDITAGD
jgi:hypothetical protein